MTSPVAPVAPLRSVVLDCPDPRLLAEFYAEVIGGTVHDEEGDGEWIDLVAPGRVKVSFQRVTDYTPPEWPRADTNPQQFHLDLDGGSTWEAMDAAHERVLALGARPLDLDDDGGKRDWRVYADPAGHPFCLCLCV
ncbi:MULTISPECIES: VOC family protein [Streptomyces]|uniref:Glyoxalase n=2 Tax=Streptomyces TaxID=1883 RepID=A0A0W7X972_9ACTN|nr:MULTISPECIES: VOC family protein [Streptomyces]KUF19448.1 glyoxalase [Streptomyces silvensis]MVO85861.1 VOC family protein [Streptomyces typhae]